MDTYPAEDRAYAFHDGVRPSESIAYQQYRLNASVPRTFTPRGVNQQVAFSGIGWSARDVARLTLGATPISGSLPSSNGSSAATNEKRRPFQSQFASAQY